MQKGRFRRMKDRSREKYHQNRYAADTISTKHGKQTEVLQCADGRTVVPCEWKAHSTRGEQRTKYTMCPRGKQNDSKLDKEKDRRNLSHAKTTPQEKQAENDKETNCYEGRATGETNEDTTYVIERQLR